jgi:hypothetical protein
MPIWQEGAHEVHPLARLGLTLLAGLLAVAPARAQSAARAQDAPANCEVPAYLLTTESTLPKVEHAVKAASAGYLVVGSRSSTISTSEG